MTHEHSLLTCAAYRALTSDGRFRRLCVIADASGARLERVNPADMLTKHLDKPKYMAYASRLYNRDLTKLPEACTGKSCPVQGGGVRSHG